jgi:maleylacetate reductase
VTLQGTHRFSTQDKLIYGHSAEGAVAGEVAAAGLARAFVVTNRSLMNTPLVASIISALGPRFAGAYSECAAHSPRQSVLDGATAAYLAKADVIVAIGGGSVIDAAKVMLGCLWDGLSTSADLDCLLTDGHETLPARAVRMIAVPTTLSAAEFTPLAGITDPERGTKDLFQHPFYAPSIVVLDPDATLTTPEWLLLSTGVRSIDHCVETLCSSRPSPYADALAGEGLRRLSSGLRALRNDPTDPGARLDCQLGAWLSISGPVSGVPLGASHAIGRVLGAACGVPHGHTSCILLPGVLRWNSSADEGRQRSVAQLMGAAGDVTASEAVATLVSDLGQPSRLRDVSVDRDKFQILAERSLQMLSHPATSGNQRSIRTTDEVLEILELVH